jgi:hypothetical protein
MQIGFLRPRDQIIALRCVVVHLIVLVASWLCLVACFKCGGLCCSCVPVYSLLNTVRHICLKHC